MRDVPIRGDMIRLGQLLKLAGVADSGSEAKELLADGGVTVNGEQAAALARRDALERYLRARAARTQRLRPRKPASMPRA